MRDKVPQARNGEVRFMAAGGRFGPRKARAALGWEIKRVLCLGEEELPLDLNRGISRRSCLEKSMI